MTITTIPSFIIALLVFLFVGFGGSATSGVETGFAEGFGEASAMPPVRGVLDNREIRDVIAYLKTL